MILRKNKTYWDKYTYSYIQKSITKDAEEQKEENHDLEQLETEARQSLKAMLTIELKKSFFKNKTIIFRSSRRSREIDEPVGR